MEFLPINTHFIEMLVRPAGLRRLISRFASRRFAVTLAHSPPSVAAEKVTDSPQIRRGNGRFATISPRKKPIRQEVATAHGTVALQVVYPDLFILELFCKNTSDQRRRDDRYASYH